MTTTMTSRVPVHVIASTHTTRHLRWALLGLAHQSVAPASITLTCDTDDPALSECAAACAKELGLVIRHVRRPHQGREMLAQVRNNGIRALLESGLARDEDLLLMLDGDCVLAHDAVERHGTHGANADMVVAFRVDLTEAQTARADESRLARGELPVEPDAGQSAAIRRRHRRYLRQSLLRRVGLAKPHTPKPLGGHHAVRLGRMIEINGYDEQYHTWGTEDDDLGRRVYAAGGRSRVAVAEITCLHMYHPTRNPGVWKDRPNARRFAAGGPARCRHGLDHPLEQGPVEVTVLGDASAVPGGAGR